MRPAIRELFQKTFQKDVFIVAGGPSLREFDFSRLRNKVTIAINSSYERLPEATALYWADDPWAAENYDSLLAHPCKLRFHARFSVSDDVMNNKLGTGLSTLLRRTGVYGIDPCKDNVRGNNSGAHALNLIANMRPSRIILLGYDMRATKHLHWHDYAKVPPYHGMYKDEFVPCIESMAEPIAKSGIKVINCSMESALMCFEKDTIENYLGDDE